MKLAMSDTGSRALRQRVLGARLASSVLARAEVWRAIRRSGADLAVLPELLAAVVLIDLDATTLDLAGRIDPPELRSIDAIHLATAMSLGADLDGFVTYDRQQGRAAAAAGLHVESPR